MAQDATPNPAPGEGTSFHPEVDLVHGDPAPGSEATQTKKVPNMPNLNAAIEDAEEGAEKCWNCAAQKVERVPKLVKGVCKKCGFDLTKIHMPDLIPKQQAIRSQNDTTQPATP